MYEYNFHHGALQIRNLIITSERKFRSNECFAVPVRYIINWRNKCSTPQISASEGMQ